MYGIVSELRSFAPSFFNCSLSCVIMENSVIRILWSRSCTSWYCSPVPTDETHQQQHKDDNVETQSWWNAGNNQVSNCTKGGTPRSGTQRFFAFKSLSSNTMVRKITSWPSHLSHVSFYIQYGFSVPSCVIDDIIYIVVDKIITGHLLVFNMDEISVYTMGIRLCTKLTRRTQSLIATPIFPAIYKFDNILYINTTHMCFRTHVFLWLSRRC